MAYRQSKNLTILHISVIGREVATKIAKDLRHIISLGYRFTGVVSDGGTGIVKAVNDVFPHKPHQISAQRRYQCHWKISKERESQRLKTFSRSCLAD